MPVEFLSDAEAEAFGRFDGPLSRADLDRVFFLDDTDRELIDKRRGPHNRLGFALQLTTVRWLGTFLPDPTDVPAGLVEYVADQLGSSVLEEWLAARAWATGDGPRAMFEDAVGRLRTQRVLLPGVTTLARLVAGARAAAEQRLWSTLAAVVSAEQRPPVEGVLDVREGSRFSEPERFRKGPADPTGRNLVVGLRRVADLRAQLDTVARSARTAPSG